MKNHDIENVVVTFGERSRDTWWQSKNMVQKVTIQVDLEAEFHFTHLIMNFKSSKPYSLMIERSPDYGVTWKVVTAFVEITRRAIFICIHGNQSQYRISNDTPNYAYR